MEDPFKEPDRKLAAILAADVVGFSRMMGADEGGTLTRLHAARQQVIDPIMEAHRGRIFKVLGDGLLVEFPSVVLALRAAVAVQTQLPEHTAGDAPDRRIVLRIGLHQGDVIVHGTDLLGDGVNIAARLEPLAPPGGICVSARVREDAAGKVPFRIDDGGERELKNIARPMRVFFVHPGQGTDPDETAQGRVPALAAPVGSEADADGATMVAKPTDSWSLVVVETTPAGPLAGHVVKLDKLPLVLGRLAPSDLLLPSGEVSRRHCRIDRAGRAAVVTDMGSTNGTFLDDQRIDAPSELRPGSSLRIGPFVMRYLSAAFQPAPPEDLDATRVIRPRTGPTASDRG